MHKVLVKILNTLHYRIAILLGIAILVSCENKIIVVDDEVKPVIEVWDFKREDSENGIKKMRLTSAYMQSFTTDSNIYMFPQGFILETFSYKDGVEVIEARLTADSARYVEGFRLDAYKNVVVRNKKNDELRTNFLSWDEKLEMITTPEPVEIIKDGEKINGIGLEARQDFSFYKLTQTTGIISVDSE